MVDKNIDGEESPPWFIERMMTDSWQFGLLTTSGLVICISSITRMSVADDGSMWIDVELTDKSCASEDNVAQDKLYAPTERTKASIQASHIVAAFELASS